MVKCDVEYDFENNKKRYIRTDTNEVAQEVDISDEERQMQLDLEEDGEHQEDSVEEDSLEEDNSEDEDQDGEEE